MLCSGDRAFVLLCRAKHKLKNIAKQNQIFSFRLTCARSGEIFGLFAIAGNIWICKQFEKYLDFCNCGQYLDLQAIGKIFGFFAIAGNIWICKQLEKYLDFLQLRAI